jgi:hypothetical protein
MQWPLVRNDKPTATSKRAETLFAVPFCGGKAWVLSAEPHGPAIMKEPRLNQGIDGMAIEQWRALAGAMATYGLFWRALLF